MTDAKLIEKRIGEMGSGKAFTASDFSGLSTARNIRNVLGRMQARGDIERAMRGVYYVPEKSALLGSAAPLGVDEVVRAIARSNKWIVAPAGDAALNAVGLDAQVPANLAYVSSGPYKTYEYGPYTIAFKHRANRDLLDCSETTCILVQALKALGKENVGDETARILAANLTDDQIDTFKNEAEGLTSWVGEFARKLWEVKNG